MDTKQIIPGIVTAMVVFGVYFIGSTRGQPHPIPWRQIFTGMTAGVTCRGLAWAITLPVMWVVLYYAFVGHVWVSLGRWPHFGERLEDWFISVHAETIRYYLGSLLASLYVAPVFMVSCILVPRYRRIAIYSAVYGVAVGMAMCALHLAPHSFLNWFFD